MTSSADAYAELSAYTLAHALQDPSFLHQHVVDAWMAQNADAGTKPMALTFALVGLYLHLERGFTGRQVQQAHIRLARRPRAWPLIALPSSRGAVTPVDVIAVAAGPARDRAIDAWCHSVWTEYRSCAPAIVRFLTDAGIVSPP